MITGIIFDNGGGSQCSLKADDEYIEITIVNDGIPGRDQQVVSHYLTKDDIDDFCAALKKLKNA